ncbi:S8 family serine peptidase [Bacillus subtilis]|nr:S8 family serine peptidase [Bacillus subtilis]
MDFNHPDLKNNILNKGKSFVPYIEDTQDYLGHGTMVAGVIALSGDLLGVGPALGIVPYKVFQDNSAESTWIINAIIQAAKDNINVINLSLSTYLSKFDKNDRVLINAFQNALLFAKQKGSIVVASAGNDALNLNNPKTIANQRGDLNDYQYHFPGGNKDVITVSSTSKEKNLASYSNYGKITFAAPGGDYGPYFNDLKEFDISSWILVNYPTNLPQSTLSKNLGLPKGYELDVGSSLATPKVSALIALLIAEYEEKHNKKPSRTLVINLLKKGAIDLGTKGFDDQFGYGEINVVKSLNSVN